MTDKINGKTLEEIEAAIKAMGVLARGWDIAREGCCFDDLPDAQDVIDEVIDAEPTTLALVSRVRELEPKAAELQIKQIEALFSDYKDGPVIDKVRDLIAEVERLSDELEYTSDDRAHFRDEVERLGGGSRSVTAEQSDCLDRHGRDLVALASVIVGLEARLEAVPSYCPYCGPNTPLDEDLCCANCGHEATIEGLVNRIHELDTPATGEGE